MKNIRHITNGLFLGYISLAEAVKLGLPHYDSPFYGDTWRYTGEKHFVNQTQWVTDAPKAYSTIQE